MNKTAKIILTVILAGITAVALLGCNFGSPIENYADVDSITVDEASISSGFLLSDFDISKVKLNVKYKDTTDALGATVAGETVQISAQANMVRAEDKAKLSVPGRHTITLQIRRFTLTFELVLRDVITETYRVTFYDENGARLGDVQYVAHGGRAIQPALPTNTDGKTFIGWRDRDTGNMATFDNILKDTVLQAVYAPDKYSVSFYRRLENREEHIATVDVPRGEEAYNYAPELAPVQGFVNGRWEDITAMKRPVQSEGLRFYAVYDPDYVQVSFRFMRYGTAMGIQTNSVKAGTELRENDLPEPAREGYRFIEWLVDGKTVAFPYTVKSEVVFEARYVSIAEGSPGLIFDYTDQGDTLAISGYTGTDTIVVIPKEAVKDGSVFPVTKLLNRVFDRVHVREFVISDDNEYFTTVDNVLYSKDMSLLYVYPDSKPDVSFVVPDTVVEIRPYAFYGTYSLVNITLNDNLQLIDDYAFANCDSITSVVFKKSLTRIFNSAFYCENGSALTTLNFDDAVSLVDIGPKAFKNAVLLRSVYLPVSLKFLGDSAFEGCKSLAVIAAEDNKNFTVVNGGLYSADRSKLFVFPALYGSEGSAVLNTPEITLDPLCTEIAQGAFSYTKLTSVVIESDVIKINVNAFDSSNLRRIFLNSRVIDIESDSFGRSSLEVYINASKIEAQSEQDLRELLSYNESKVLYFNEEDWTAVMDFNEDYMYEIYEYVTVNNGVPGVAKGVRILGSRNAFGELKIPDMLGTQRVTSIAAHAFDGDIGITTVELPSDLLEIGEYAFANIPLLTRVSFNATVTKVGNYAFYNCPQLREVRYGELTGITDFGKSVFDRTPFLSETSRAFIVLGNVLIKYVGFSTNVDIPASVGYIASDAFVNHGEITSIVFEEGDETVSGITIVDSRAFQYCEGLVQISFPSSLRELRSEAFFGCDLFTASFGITRNNARLSIASDAFSGDEPVLVYSDDIRYQLSYVEDDAGNTHSENGVVIISPYAIANTRRSRFAGWFFDEEYRELAVFPLVLTKDEKLYSKWIGLNDGSNGIQFRLTDDGTYSVSGYIGADSYVIVPDKYLEKNVTGIDSGAFKNKNISYIELPHEALTTVTYTSKIVSIGADAFAGTPWFESYYGDFVVIDDFLIRYKGSASEVILPTGIRAIAQGAFKNNGYIKRVVLHDEITDLADGVFENCSALEEIVLPATLNSIGNAVFKNCGKLSRINFSSCKDLSSVGYDALDGTAWLNEYIDPCVVINNAILYKYKYQGDYINSLHIFSGITSIGENAFAGNDNLKRIYIPQSVTYIGKGAFENSFIEEVYLFAGGSNLITIQDNAFANARKLYNFNLSVANRLEYIGVRAFYNCGMLMEAYIPASTVEMGESVFEKSGLTEVNFMAGSKLQEIPASAFKTCYSLKSVTFTGASELTSIADSAFYSCQSLLYFDNAEGKLVSIGDYAFYYCESLTKLRINETTLTSIGNHALEAVGYSSGDFGFVVLGNILIRYDANETVVTIPDNVTTIYNGAFEGNKRLRRVIFTDRTSVTNINSAAFKDCSALEEIEFPSTVKYVGEEVMAGTRWYDLLIRDNVEFITIANTLIKYNSTEGKQVVIPDGVEVINSGAFDGSVVFDILLNTGLKSIEDGAFDGISCPVQGGWTLTVPDGVRPEMKVSTLISAGKILIDDESYKDYFRLTDGWNIQYDKVTVMNKFELEYSIPAAQGEPVEVDNPVYALYAQQDATTTENYIFVGWYIDSDLRSPVSYPLILEDEVYKRVMLGSEFGNLLAEILGDDIRDNLAESADYDTLFNEIRIAAARLIVDNKRFGTNFERILAEKLEQKLKEGVEVIEVTNSVMHRLTDYIDAVNDFYIVRVYAKCIDKTVGSNGEDYSTVTGGWIYDEDNGTHVKDRGEFVPDNNGNYREGKAIKMYYGDTDGKIVIISEQGGMDIAAITGSWISDTVNGTHIKDGDEYVPSPNGNYRFVGAFENHDELTEVYFALNSKIDVIGAGAFKNCSKLEKIVLPSSVTTIEEGAFEGCTSLKEIVFASDCRELNIMAGAFRGCASLETITLPINLRVLRGGAFAGCFKLTDIYSMAPVAVSLAKDENDETEKPFELVADLRIHVYTSSLSSYSVIWEPYSDCLVGGLENINNNTEND